LPFTCGTVGFGMLRQYSETTTSSDTSYG
jgi:hypothetical protein